MSPVVVGEGTLEWRRSLLWLAFLGPFFFASYGFANHLAAQHVVTESLVFDWERHVPFVPWTILPYWSIDLFYGLSFLCCRGHAAVDRHAMRLLTAQLICVSTFVLFPLHFSFDRPATDGLFGAMFEALMGFDQPYNQAPSLHIALLVIIWVRFAEAVPVAWRWLVHGWATLIAGSVLTTFQHHFFDIPSGAAVGLLCVWLWPDGQSSPLTERVQGNWSRRFRLATCYVVAALAMALTAVTIGGWALWLCWSALALIIVAAIYLGPGTPGFQKHNGRHSLAARWLLAPYFIGAWLNSRWWTRPQPESNEVIDGVWLGRIPTCTELASGRFLSVLDLTAEMAGPVGRWHYEGLPWLDLIPPSLEQLRVAAERIEAMRERGPLLVCCALGYSRSACAVVAWMLWSGRAAGVDDAMSIVCRSRPQVVLGNEHRSVLSALLERRYGCE